MRAIALAAVLAVVGLTGAASTASADPWKDESGHGRWRGGYERGDGFPGRGYGYGRERRFERQAFRERAYDRYDERPARRVYRYRSVPAYGYYNERPVRRVYRSRAYPAYGYYPRRRAQPQLVVRFGRSPAYGYHRY